MPPSFMRCETTVGTEKRRRLITVSLNAINYKCGARSEINFFSITAPRGLIELQYIQWVRGGGREVFLIELQYIQWVRGGGREVFLIELQYTQWVRGGGREVFLIELSNSTYSG